MWGKSNIQNHLQLEKREEGGGQGWGRERDVCLVLWARVPSRSVSPVPLSITVDSEPLDPFAQCAHWLSLAYELHF